MSKPKLAKFLATENEYFINDRKYSYANSIDSVRDATSSSWHNLKEQLHREDGPALEKVSWCHEIYPISAESPHHSFGWWGMNATPKISCRED